MTRTNPHYTSTTLFRSVRIENTIAKANRQDARSQYLTLQATEARLMAELEEREEIEFPPAVTNEAPVVAADQERLFSARCRQLEAQVNVLESQARPRQQEVARSEEHTLNSSH